MSLCYNPTANTITVSIIKARNLKAMDIGGTSGKDVPSFHVFALLLFYIIAASKRNEKLESETGFSYGKQV